MNKARCSFSINTGFTKVTAGFVCQQYQKDKSGKFICIHQEFIACDEVQYEDSKGETICSPEHIFQPFNMALLNGPQIAEILRKALDRLQMRGQFDLGVQTLKALLKNLS